MIRIPDCRRMPLDIQDAHDVGARLEPVCEMAGMVYGGQVSRVTTRIEIVRA